MLPSTSQNIEIPDAIIGGKYKLVRKIGSGSFGDVHLGIHLRSGEKVAIKVESLNVRYPVLASEAKVYYALSRGIGIPKIHYHAKEKNFYVLVLDLLGPTLEDLYKLCKRQFTLKTILMLVDQMISRLEFVHLRGFIHRDLKPDNFLMGIDADAKKLFLIDFGLAAAFRNLETHKHVPFGKTAKIIGSTRYSSINANAAMEQSRRDDMEALGYVLVYFMQGSLPWQGITALTKPQKREKILEKKMSISPEALCRGLPVEFTTYLNYCRGLAFDKPPNYIQLRKMFRGLSRKLRYEYNDIYDWTFLMDATTSDQSETDETEKTMIPKKIHMARRKKEHDKDKGKEKQTQKEEKEENTEKQKKSHDEMKEIENRATTSRKLKMEKVRFDRDKKSDQSMRST